MNIIYCSDKGYFKFLRLSILSLLEHNDNVVFHILTMDSPETNQQALTNSQVAKLKSECAETGKNFEIVFYDVRNLYMEVLSSSKNANSIFTPYAGLKLLIPFVCNIDKGLYLDCDFIILKSIEEIYNQDISHDFLLAHLDKDFFYTGVYLYNIKKDKEDNFLRAKKAISFYVNNLLRFPDQEALNFAYGKVRSLRLKKIFMYDENTYMFHISSKHLQEVITFLDNIVFNKQGKSLHGRYHSIVKVLSCLQNDTSEANNSLNN